MFKIHLFFVNSNKILFLLRENTGYMDGYYTEIKQDCFDHI